MIVARAALVSTVITLCTLVGPRHRARFLCPAMHRDRLTAIYAQSVNGGAAVPARRATPPADSERNCTSRKPLKLGYCSSSRAVTTYVMNSRRHFPPNSEGTKAPPKLNSESGGGCRGKRSHCIMLHESRGCVCIYDNTNDNG
ncbi:hypothetical protein FKP32DRAFT_1586277 [Trametes sanguinea]|nr:hypothetical protein FKP32DRAFT_1586277 [Trametes sanguinea]